MKNRKFLRFLLCIVAKSIRRKAALKGAEWEKVVSYHVVAFRPVLRRARVKRIHVLLLLAANAQKALVAFAASSRA